MGLKIEPLDSRKHNRSDFCCEKDSLDDYIRKQASQDLKKRVSTVFVLIDEPEFNVLAYYTLSSLIHNAMNGDFNSPPSWNKRCAERILLKVFQSSIECFGKKFYWRHFSI